MDSISLTPMTEALYHEYYRSYEHDPDLFQNMDTFRPFAYSESWVDAYIKRQTEKKRLVFAVMRHGAPIGEVVLKNIDYTEKVCTLGICLQNDKVKNHGIGTKAEQLILDYAAKQLGTKTVYANAILKNKRSQHVLEKVGFQMTGKDAQFIYYRYDCK